MAINSAIDYYFEFRPYHQPFSQPLTTNHGVWRVREGIIIRLTNALGNPSYGEIAPIPWFGSETLGEALEFCQQLSSRITHEEILGICDRLPATQFGFGSAWESLLSFSRDNEVGTPPTPLQKGGEEVTSLQKVGPPLTPLQKGGEEVTPLQKVGTPLTPLQKGGEEVAISFVQENKKILDIVPPFLRGEDITPPFLRGAGGVSPDLSTSGGVSPNLSTYSYLLPTGIAALKSWQTPWQQGYRTFKWKIGVASLHQELDQLQQLVHLLPSGAKLRLDANGGLNLEQAKLWLEECDRHNSIKNSPHPLTPLRQAQGIASPIRREGEHESLTPLSPLGRGVGGEGLGQSQISHLAKIEFLEQPLPVDSFPDLLTLEDSYETSIALDESVATLGQLKNCYGQGWRGVFVIKPSIVGYGDRLREFCQNHCQDQPLDVVFSSSLETAIGRNHALKLAQELNNPQRALGFGVDRWLNIDQETLIQQLWQGH